MFEMPMDAKNLLLLVEGVHKVFTENGVKSMLARIDQQYVFLFEQTRKVKDSLTMFPVSVRWEYVLDPATGLEVLKCEKDPEALDKIRRIAEKLFE